MPLYKLTVRPARTALLLGAGALMLGFCFAVAKILVRYFGFDMNRPLFQFFDLGHEVSLPTFYATVLLIGAAAILCLISRVARGDPERSAWPWYLLAAGFMLMAIDESTSIHEGIVGPVVASLLPAQTGVWSHVWYIPYAPLIALLLIVFIPFLRRLERRFTILFLASGALYVSGAVGMEMVESWIRYHGVNGLESISILIEELLEMLGVVLFIYTLLSYLDEYPDPISVQLETGSAHA